MRRVRFREAANRAAMVYISIPQSSRESKIKENQISYLDDFGFAGVQVRLCSGHVEKRSTSFFFPKKEGSTFEHLTKTLRVPVH